MPARCVFLSSVVCKFLSRENGLFNLSRLGIFDNGPLEPGFCRPGVLSIVGNIDNIW